MVPCTGLDQNQVAIVLCIVSIRQITRESRRSKYIQPLREKPFSKTSWPWEKARLIGHQSHFNQSAALYILLVFLAIFWAHFGGYQTCHNLVLTGKRNNQDKCNVND